MELSCEVVMDLLPLYADGLASEESGKLIREHLRACPACRKFYHSYHRLTAAPACPPAESEAPDSDKFHELSARMRKRHLVSTAAICGIVAASVGATLLSLHMTYRKTAQPQR